MSDSGEKKSAVGSESKTVDIASALVRGSVSKAVAAGKTNSAPSSAAKPRAKSSKKSKAAEEERDAEGVKSSGGVGSLVLEKKAKSKPKKRKADDEDEEEASDGEDEEDVPKKKTKKPKAAAAAGASGDKSKRGASSVDLTKGTLTPQEERHEFYMQYTVDKLKHVLACNLISLPKPCTKDKLAWMCVYGEVLGAPPGLCARCGKGKLKPKLKKNEFGVAEVKKGVTKWTCPGYFDEESDQLAFCNKAYTDKEVHPVKFKSIDEITPEDEESAKKRILKGRAQADKMIHATHSEDESASVDDAAGDAGDGKKHHKHAQRLHSNDELEAEMARAAERLKRHPNGSDSDEDDATSSAAADDETMHAAPAVDADLAGFITDSVAAPSQYAAAPAKNGSPAPPAAAAASSAATSKPMCQYGASCYRQNPAHRAEFAHPQ